MYFSENLSLSLVFGGRKAGSFDIVLRKFTDSYDREMEDGFDGYRTKTIFQKNIIF